MSERRVGSGVLGLVAAGALAASCSALPSSPATGGGAGSQPASTAEVERSTVPSGGGPSVRLVRLADGDSGWFAVDDGGGEREVEIRLLGYNAPEKYEGRNGPLSCNGEAARQALADLVEGATTVELVGEETDRFGRLLADLVVDGVSAVDRMVADGRGLAIGDDHPDRRELMRQAAADRRGLWGDGCGSPAAEGIEVAAVEPDPPGRDDENLNGEYVELVNRGPEPIDLAGWDIRDDSSSHRFDLDAAGVLGPGDTLVVRTGPGSTTGGQLHLDAGTPIWSNRTDTVLVVDPDGVVTAWAFIG